jgi:predicted ribosome quality control (RQC) complex YloA/Tae2 family protein
MELDQAADDAIEKLRDALDHGKLPRGIRDLLESKIPTDEFQAESDLVRERAERIREQIAELETEADEIESEADAIGSVAEAIAAALDQVEEWENAEGRDDKAHARESLLDALTTITEALDEIGAEGSGALFDADGYDILTPEEKEINALVERLAHAAVADWLNESRAQVLARLPENAEVPVKVLASEVDSIIGVHEVRGDPDFVDYE